MNAPHKARRPGIRHAYQAQEKVSDDCQRRQTAMESPACSGQCDEKCLAVHVASQYVVEWTVIHLSEENWMHIGIFNTDIHNSHGWELLRRCSVSSH